MRVLIAEDSDDLRQLMKLLLQEHGYEVDEAANGQEAISTATMQVPDVILMDLAMPVMDGIAATHKLREIPSTRDVPIIAISAYLDDPAWRDKAVAAGCCECVSKPIDLAGLNSILRRCLRGARKEVRAPSVPFLQPTACPAPRSVSAADRAYLGQMISRKTGFEPARRGKKVSDAITQTKAAEVKACEAADAARKAAAQV